MLSDSTDVLRRLLGRVGELQRAIERLQARESGRPPISLPIEAAFLITATGATLATYHRAISFADGADNVALWNVKVPPGWGGRTVVVKILWAPSSTNTGTVRWRNFALKQVAGTTLSATPDVGNADTDQAAAGTADRPQALTFPAMSLASIAAEGDGLTVGIQRVGADAADTFTGAARLLAVELSVTG